MTPSFAAPGRPRQPDPGQLTGRGRRPESRPCGAQERGALGSPRASTRTAGRPPGRFWELGTADPGGRSTRPRPGVSPTRRRAMNAETQPAEMDLALARMVVDLTLEQRTELR